MQNLIALLVATVFVIHIQSLMGLPLNNGDIKRSDSSDGALLPTADFSMITKEKLHKLKELADAINDSKVKDLYRAVNHYVQLAKKNNEYVLWKYDASQGGLVLSLKPNRSGILYYGR